METEIELVTARAQSAVVPSDVERRRRRGKRRRRLVAIIGGDANVPTATATEDKERRSEGSPLVRICKKSHNVNKIRQMNTVCNRNVEDRISYVPKFNHVATYPLKNLWLNDQEKLQLGNTSENPISNDFQVRRVGSNDAFMKTEIELEFFSSEILDSNYSDIIFTDDSLKNKKVSSSNSKDYDMDASREEFDTKNNIESGLLPSESIPPRKINKYLELDGIVRNNSCESCSKNRKKEPTSLIPPLAKINKLFGRVETRETDSLTRTMADSENFFTENTDGSSTEEDFQVCGTSGFLTSASKYEIVFDCYSREVLGMSGLFTADSKYETMSNCYSREKGFFSTNNIISKHVEEGAINQRSQQSVKNHCYADLAYSDKNNCFAFDKFSSNQIHVLENDFLPFPVQNTKNNQNHNKMNDIWTEAIRPSVLQDDPTDDFILATQQKSLLSPMIGGATTQLSKVSESYDNVEIEFKGNHHVRDEKKKAYEMEVPLFFSEKYLISDTSTMFHPSFCSFTSRDNISTYSRNLKSKLAFSEKNSDISLCQPFVKEGFSQNNNVKKFSWNFLSLCTYRVQTGNCSYIKSVQEVINVSDKKKKFAELIGLSSCDESSNQRFIRVDTRKKSIEKRSEQLTEFKRKHPKSISVEHCFLIACAKHIPGISVKFMRRKEAASQLKKCKPGWSDLLRFKQKYGYTNIGKFYEPNFGYCNRIHHQVYWGKKCGAVGEYTKMNSEWGQAPYYHVNEIFGRTDGTFVNNSKMELTSSYVKLRHYYIYNFLGRTDERQSFMFYCPDFKALCSEDDKHTRNHTNLNYRALSSTGNIKKMYSLLAIDSSISAMNLLNLHKCLCTINSLMDRKEIKRGLKRSIGDTIVLNYVRQCSKKCKSFGISKNDMIENTSCKMKSSLSFSSNLPCTVMIMTQEESTAGAKSVNVCMQRLDRGVTEVHNKIEKHDRHIRVFRSKTASDLLEDVDIEEENSLPSSEMNNGLNLLDLANMQTLMFKQRPFTNNAKVTNVSTNLLEQDVSLLMKKSILPQLITVLCHSLLMKESNDSIFVHGKIQKKVENVRKFRSKSTSDLFKYSCVQVINSMSSLKMTNLSNISDLRCTLHTLMSIPRQGPDAITKVTNMIEHSLMQEVLLQVKKDILPKFFRHSFTVKELIDYAFVLHEKSEKESGHNRTSRSMMSSDFYEDFGIEVEDYLLSSKMNVSNTSHLPHLWIPTPQQGSSASLEATNMITHPPTHDISPSKKKHIFLKYVNIPCLSPFAKEIIDGAVVRNKIEKEGRNNMAFKSNIPPEDVGIPCYPLLVQESIVNVIVHDKIEEGGHDVAFKTATCPDFFDEIDSNLKSSEMNSVSNVSDLSHMLQTTRLRSSVDAKVKNVMTMKEDFFRQKNVCHADNVKESIDDITIVHDKIEKDGRNEIAFRSKTDSDLFQDVASIELINNLPLSKVKYVSTLPEQDIAQPIKKDILPISIDALLQSLGIQKLINEVNVVHNKIEKEAEDDMAFKSNISSDILENGSNKREINHSSKMDSSSNVPFPFEVFESHTDKKIRVEKCVPKVLRANEVKEKKELGDKVADQRKRPKFFPKKPRKKKKVENVSSIPKMNCFEIISSSPLRSQKALCKASSSLFSSRRTRLCDFQKKKRSETKKWGFHKKNWQEFPSKEETIEQDRLLEESRKRLLMLLKEQAAFNPNDLTTLPENHWKWKDPYARLGLAPFADVASIKKNYRKLALKYHPDKSTLPHTLDCFCAIKAAYERLKRERSI